MKLDSSRRRSISIFCFSSEMSQSFNLKNKKQKHEAFPKKFYTCRSLTFFMGITLMSYNKKSFFLNTLLHILRSLVLT